MQKWASNSSSSDPGQLTGSLESETESVSVRTELELGGDGGTDSPLAGSASVSSF